MADYTFSINIGTTSDTYTAKVTDLYACNDEAYKTAPKILFTFTAKDTYSNISKCIATSLSVHGSQENEGRVAMSIGDFNSQGLVSALNGAGSHSGATFSGTYGIDIDPSFIPANAFSNVASLPSGNYGSWESYMYVGISEWTLSTNIPVFETDARALTYITTGEGLEHAVNYSYQERIGEEFSISNIWTHGTWSASGLSGISAQNYRMVKGKILTGGRIAFYKKSGIVDGALQYGVSISGSFEGLQYCTDGVTWHDSAEFPFNFFYRERDNEIGTFNFGLTFYASIPVFSDETTADKYVEGDPSVTIKDAINWPQISGEYPASNTTGSALPASIFGDVKLKGFFSQQYICDSTCLSAIANDLFDTSEGGIWEYMKKGLDMYGNAAPIEAVMGLSFWPFNVSDFIGAGNYAAANYIWFGGYGWDTTGHGTCNQIIYASGYKDLGTVRIAPTFNNWRDYEPYTKLYVSIPYCGTYQLDIARYLGKDVRVRYFIDTRTNGCMCALIADNYLMDYFNGQMGVTMPITLTDYAAYMNAQMQVLLQGGGQAVQSGMNAYSGASGFGAMGGGAGLAAGLIAGGAPAAISGAVTGAKTVFGLAQNNINKFNVTKGGSSSMINCYLPQTVDFIFEIQEDCAPSNYRQMLGSPSMAAGIVGSFSGFLKCQSVKVNAGKATEREKERIKQMLLSGIYI